MILSDSRNTGIPRGIGAGDMNILCSLLVHDKKDSHGEQLWKIANPIPVKVNVSNPDFKKILEGSTVALVIDTVLTMWRQEFKTLFHSHSPDNTFIIISPEDKSMFNQVEAMVDVHRVDHPVEGSFVYISGQEFEGYFDAHSGRIVGGSAPTVKPVNPMHVRTTFAYTPNTIEMMFSAMLKDIPNPTEINNFFQVVHDGNAIPYYRAKQSGEKITFTLFSDAGFTKPIAFNKSDSGHILYHVPNGSKTIVEGKNGEVLHVPSTMVTDYSHITTLKPFPIPVSTIPQAGTNVSMDFGIPITLSGHATKAFTFTVNGKVMPLKNISTHNNLVILSLVHKVYVTDTVTLNYTQHGTDGLTATNYAPMRDGDIIVTNNSTVTAPKPHNPVVIKSDARSSIAGKPHISIHFDKGMKLPTSTAGLDVKINGKSVAILSLDLDSLDNKLLNLRLHQNIFVGDTVIVEYDKTAGDIQSTTGVKWLESSINVTNLSFTSPIPPFVSATTSIDGTKVIATYGADLESVTKSTKRLGIQVKVNGTIASTANAIVNGKTISIKMVTPILAKTVVEWSYGDVHVIVPITSKILPHANTGTEIENQTYSVTNVSTATGGNVATDTETITLDKADVTGKDTSDDAISIVAGLVTVKKDGIYNVAVKQPFHLRHGAFTLSWTNNMLGSGTQGLGTIVFLDDNGVELFTFGNTAYSTQTSKYGMAGIHGVTKWYGDLNTSEPFVFTHTGTTFKFKTSPTAQPVA